MPFSSPRQASPSGCRIFFRAEDQRPRGLTTSGIAQKERRARPSCVADRREGARSHTTVCVPMLRCGRQPRSYGSGGGRCATQGLGKLRLLPAQIRAPRLPRPLARTAHGECRAPFLCAAVRCVTELGPGDRMSRADATSLSASALPRIAKLEKWQGAARRTHGHPRWRFSKFATIFGTPAAVLFWRMPRPSSSAGCTPTRRSNGVEVTCWKNGVFLRFWS